MKIYVDAMGGDLAPEAPVKGALKALRQFPHLTIILAGRLDEVKPFLGDYEDVKDRLILEEQPEVITNHESPVMGVRKKVNSATVQGMLKVRSGEADGFVSAGSTGATLAGGMFRLGRIPGIERPALAPLMPNGRGHFLLIDCGANVDCKPEYLVQFGIMGDAYMRGVMGMENPRIGLVNIGAEAEKGNALVKETYPLMEKAPYNFIGNVEARDVPLDQADVCVTDGFGGNLILKYTEGLAKALTGMLKEELMRTTRSKIGALLLKPALKNFKKRMSAEEVGGAPLLGVNGAMVKAHGNSGPVAIKNAIRQARSMTEGGVVETIRAGVEKLLPEKE